MKQEDGSTWLLGGLLILVALLVFTCGCAPQTRLVKYGAGEYQATKDSMECEYDVDKSVPLDYSKSIVQMVYQQNMRNGLYEKCMAIKGYHRENVR